MMMRKISKHLINLYYIISIIGYIMLLCAGLNTWLFLGIGASSGWISFGIGTAEETSMFVRILCMLWCISFPVFFLISYIKAIKRRYTLMKIFLISDVLIVVFWTISTVFASDWFAFRTAIWDLSSSAITTCLLFLTSKTERQTNY